MKQKVSSFLRCQNKGNYIQQLDLDLLQSGTYYVVNTYTSLVFVYKIEVPAALACILQQEKKNKEQIEVGGQYTDISVTFLKENKIKTTTTTLFSSISRLNR